MSAEPPPAMTFKKPASAPTKARIAKDRGSAVGTGKQGLHKMAEPSETRQSRSVATITRRVHKSA